MDPSHPELTLEEFVVEMGREPVRKLSHPRFLGLVDRLRLSDELVEDRIHFLDGEYARNLLLRTPHFELLVLCWRPGQMSTIHDHAGSLNAIRVRNGELTSRMYRRVAGAPPGAGPVEQIAEEHLQPQGALVGVDRDGIHQLANSSTEDLVTVHVYAPALMELNVYSTDSALVVRRRLRHTLAQDLG